MNKKLFGSVKFMVMAMMAVVCATFASCSSGSNDDDIPGGDYSAKVGVHRIDVKFSENAKKYNPILTFEAMKKDGSYSKLYEGTKELDTSSVYHVWTMKGAQDCSVRSEENVASMVASVTIVAMTQVPEDVTVTLTAYVNEKIVKTQEFRLPAGKSSITGAFMTNESGNENPIIN